MAQVVSRKCAVCEENNSKLLCYECNQELCEMCRPVHDKFSANKQHTIVDNRDVTCINYAEKFKCKTHDQESRCFCLTCSSLICAECIIDEHKSHDVKSIKTMAYDSRMDLSKTESKVKAEMEMVFNLKTRIQNKKKTLSEGFNLLERDLKSSIDDVQNIVKGVADEYIVTAKTHLIKQEDISNSELQQVETTENGYKTFIKTLTELKKEKHDGSFVTRFKWMQDDMENLKEMPSVQSEEGFKSFERNTFLSTISNAITPSGEHERQTLKDRLLQTEIENKTLTDEIKRGERERQTLKNRLLQTEFRNKKLTAEIKSLSEVAGMKMKDNNPSFADLCNLYRPEKLSEMFREIYDNGWTNLVDAITEKTGESDDICVKQIVSALMMMYDTCKNTNTNNKREIAKLVGYPEDCFEKPYAGGKEGHDPVLKTLKDLLQVSVKRQSVAVTKNIKQFPEIKTILQDGGKTGDAFITECLQLCLYMCINDPPVVLDFSCKSGDAFNKDKFTPFTKSGSVVDYMVWPVMYLSDNGAIMSKGIAQGK